MVPRNKRGARVQRASLSSSWAAHWRAWIFVGGFLCGSIGVGSTQEAPTRPEPSSDPRMEEALRAMVRGLKDRARELGNPEEEPSKTGSIAQGPSAPAMSDDFQRLFEPRPFGPPTHDRGIPSRLLGSKSLEPQSERSAITRGISANSSRARNPTLPCALAKRFPASPCA